MRVGRQVAEPMDILIGALQLLLFAVPVGVAMAWFAQRGPDAMSGFFGPRRPDGWPIGVQEEDYDHPWGEPAPVKSRRVAREETVIATPIATVRAQVRRAR